MTTFPHRAMPLPPTEKQQENANTNPVVPFTGPLPEPALVQPVHTVPTKRATLHLHPTPPRDPDASAADGADANKA